MKIPLWLQKFILIPIILEILALLFSDNSKGAMFESIKINYKKDDFKTEKDFGIGHNLK